MISMDAPTVVFRFRFLLKVIFSTPVLRTCFYTSARSLYYRIVRVCYFFQTELKFFCGRFRPPGHQEQKWKKCMSIRLNWISCVKMLSYFIQNSHLFLFLGTPLPLVRLIFPCITVVRFLLNRTLVFFITSPLYVFLNFFRNLDLYVWVRVKIFHNIFLIFSIFFCTFQDLLILIKHRTFKLFF